jgi:hypothetical protein
MAKQFTQAERLIQTIQDWEDHELEDLQAMIVGLLEARQSSTSQPPVRQDGTPVGKRGGRGCIEIKMIPDTKRGKVYGPYKYLRYRGISRKTGKPALLSVYLGKFQGTVEKPEPEMD